MQQAITKMEQGGSTDGILQVNITDLITLVTRVNCWEVCVSIGTYAMFRSLLVVQVRADRIQHDLEELLKALVDRCKKHELNMKSTALIELPPGEFFPPCFSTS